MDDNKITTSGDLVINMFKAAASNPVIHRNTVYELQTAKTSTGELEIKLHNITNGDFARLYSITVINL